ncbi:MAG: MerR family transcriptional regulator [Beijerinckiaceae bacterium]|nr:MerR family transcriptional regulator [Beijerinckiaceae bacterium]MCI0735029.1 MerR family transcriptional regulator [Beijerinckiaceae bacterium]
MSFPRMEKSADAFRTISEAADELDLPQHVLRFWETRFPQIKPLKRAGGRRYYRPRDIDVLRAIKRLLYGEGYTIRGVQRVLREQGAIALTAPLAPANSSETDFPHPSERELNDLQDSPPWQAECAGTVTDGHSAQRAPQESLDTSFLGVSAGRSSQLNAGALAMAAEDIARLRAALAELAECEDILDAARRR